MLRVDVPATLIDRDADEGYGAPFDVDFYIGLPDDVADDRLATLHVMKLTE